MPIYLPKTISAKDKRMVIDKTIVKIKEIPLSLKKERVSSSSYALFKPLITELTPFEALHKVVTIPKDNRVLYNDTRN